MSKLIKIIGGISALLFITGVAGAIYQQQQATLDRQKYPAPGQFYQVDGLQMHLDCRGTGSPTLIMEAGLTSGSSSWAFVHDALAKNTRVCAYDRPGIDWSEPINAQADAQAVSSRLHKLLSTAGINDKKILLGMSAGGVYVRQYYQQYPEDVVAMVLVDSSHEQQGNRLPDAGDFDMNAALNLCRYLQPIGVIRATGVLNNMVENFDLSAEMAAALLANLNQSHSCAAIYWELQSFNHEIYDDQAPRALGALPLLVLSQGEPPEANPEFDFSLDDAIAQRKVWNQLQLELTQLSSQGQRIIAEKSGHVIQVDQPQLLIEQVNALVIALQSKAAR